MSRDTVRIGCASGFWGDSPAGARQLVERGAIDYLVFDYLAEITLALLARIKAKKPDAGYVPDFVAVVDELLPELTARRIRVVSNGGGMNPAAAAAELARRAAAKGLSPKIAVVTGDDVLPRIGALRERGTREMVTGEAMPESFVSANAYLGARGIALALEKGADIVVTGRCVDSAVTLGALVHEFGWRWDDFDRLSAGSLAGHLLECGAQVTGGLFTDWRDVPGWDDMGFPIAACGADGTFIIEKPPGTGGLITPLSVGEQMLYEIGDPAAYLLPDVACDWRDVGMAQAGHDIVRVTGARGRPPTGQLKVSATVADGYRTIGTVTIGGREAAAKAARVGEAVLARARRLILQAGLGDFTETSIEVLGAEATYGPHARPEARSVREVVLKLGAKHDSEAALGILTREIAPAATATAQGLTGFFAGRPPVQPVLRSFSFLTAASEVPSEVRFGDETITVPVSAESAAPIASPAVEAGSTIATGTTVPLIALAVGRSGDKGNLANIGLIAREPAHLPFIAAALTPAAVKDWFAHTGVSRVERFALPGLSALNFLLHDALGGGGVASLRIDPQGKAFAQMLMDFPVPVPSDLAAQLKGTS
jgi:hypothetical protein